MCYYFIPLLAIVCIVLILYIIELKRTAKHRETMHELDKEIERTNRATENLLLEAYRKLLNGQKK